MEGRKEGEEDVNLNLREAGLFCMASLVLVRWSCAATTSSGGLNLFTADTCATDRQYSTSCQVVYTMSGRLPGRSRHIGTCVLWMLTLM